MTAFDHSYNRRSGQNLPKVDDVTRQKANVKVPIMGKKGRPEPVTAPDQANPLLLSAWNKPGYEEYHKRLAQEGVSKDGMINAYWLVTETEVVTKGLPKISSNPSNSKLIYEGCFL